MKRKEIENLIKENFKDTALRIYDLDFEEVMMLPYEAYTDQLDSNFLEDSI